MLGALVGWKRPDLALEAVALARRRAPRSPAALVGEPLDEDGDALPRAPASARAAARSGRGRRARRGRGGRAASSREPPACSTAPRASRSAWWCSRRWPRGGPRSSPPPPGPRRSSTSRVAAAIPPGDAGAAADGAARGARRPDAGGAHGGAGAAARSSASTWRRRPQWARSPRPVAPASADAAPGSRPAGPRAGDRDRHPQLRPRAGARCCARSARHLPGARVVVVDSRRRTTRVGVRAGAAAVVTVLELERQRRLRARLQRRARARAAAGHGAAESRRGADRRLAAGAGPRGAGPPARALARAPGAASRTARARTPCIPFRRSAADLARALVPPALLPGRARCRWRPGARPHRAGWAGRSAARWWRGPRRSGGSGPFDERIFLYGEDLDLGLRAAAPASRPGSGRRPEWSTTVLTPRRAAFGGEPFELLARARHDAVARRLGPGRARRRSTPPGAHLPLARGAQARARATRRARAAPARRRCVARRR